MGENSSQPQAQEPGGLCVPSVEDFQKEWPYSISLGNSNAQDLSSHDNMDGLIKPGWKFS